MELMNIESELLLISDFYKDKMDFVKYVRFIDPYLFFSNNKTRTLFRLISLYYEEYEEFKDVDFRIFLNTDSEYKESYLAVGGIGAIEDLITLESNSLSQSFEVVRKYALLREYDSKGFNVDKIMKHESFSQITAKKIHDLVRTMCDSIKTKVDGNIEENVTITESAQEFAKNFMLNPEVGISTGWASLDDCFRGWRLGQYIVAGLSSNMGKSRHMVALAVHVAFVENQKVLIMSNEMDEQDIKSCVLVSLLNHPKFWKMAETNKVKINENDFRLGLYKDDNGEYMYRKDNEEDNEYIERVSSNSTQFRKIYAMLGWCESQLNIKYKYMRQYSNDDIEMEIKKEAFGNGCTYFFYDTLKGFKTNDWGDIKQTATRMSELAKTLQVGIFNNLQLTDSAIETNIFDMDSRDIASSKHVYHLLDSFLIGKRLNFEEYEDYHYINRKGETKELEQKFVYYGFKIAKSRSAGSHVSKDSVVLYKVDLNRNIWQDLGLLMKGGL